MRVVAIAAVCVLLASVTMADDHCSPYSTCQTCISQPLCGWCSEPVVYPDGHVGTQCAGFNSNGSQPFMCNGIYSTEQCVQGYTCDLDNFECKLSAPGTGTSKADCEANCTNNGQIFLCNHTSKQCYQVPPGTPGALPHGPCEASCIHPSHHPASPVPPPPPPALYSCNYTSGQCVNATAGHGSSKEVCEQSCQSDNNTKYSCNSFLHKCEPLPPGSPGGESKAQCDTSCAPPKPQPGPPNRFKTGLYRGVEVSQDYKMGEVDLDVNTTSVTIVKMYANMATETITGEPYHIPGATNVELIIKLTSGPNAGQMIKTLAFTSGQPGPETNFIAMAFGAPGGDAPSSIHTAWVTTGQAVYAFASCSVPQCIFSLPSGGNNGTQADPEDIIAVVEDIASGAILTATGRKSRTARKLRAKTVVDHCMQYGQSCEVCLSHQFCGWCSTNVTYKDGSEGTQCAGFNSANGSGSPFVCTGHYSTENCDEGYECDTTNYTCKMAAPGNGYPKAQCEALCKPTPPPTPPPAQYVCNTTLKQCFKCNKTHCPGSLPQGPCAAACTHPKHGPHANLIGEWRGIFIQPGYPNIECEVSFNNVSLSVFLNGQYRYTGNITSYGADAMKVDILDGRNKGWSYGATYQFASQDNEYEMITMAKGILGQSFPSSYEEAMVTPGMEVLVLAKCQGMPCKFKHLSH